MRSPLDWNGLLWRPVEEDISLRGCVLAEVWIHSACWNQLVLVINWERLHLYVNCEIFVFIIPNSKISFLHALTCSTLYLDMVCVVGSERMARITRNYIFVINHKEVQCLYGIFLCDSRNCEIRGLGLTFAFRNKSEVERISRYLHRQFIANFHLTEPICCDQVIFQRIWLLALYIHNRDRHILIVFKSPSPFITFRKPLYLGILVSGWNPLRFLGG